MKKGFTLVELLAVIIILALLALIIVPAVMNIVDKSEKSTDKISAENYIRAVKQYVTENNLFSKVASQTCEVNGTNLVCDSETLKIKIDKNQPKNGSTVSFDSDGDVEGYHLLINDSIIDYTLPIGRIVKNSTNGVDYNGTLQIGNEVQVEVKEGTIYKFYVLSIEDNKVNLIMDNNICENGSEATPNNQCGYAWHADKYYNTYGPDTAMTVLYNATKSWNKVPNMELTYTDENNQTNPTIGYTGITITNGVGQITGKNGASNTTIGTSSSPLKARLPKESEVTSVGCSITSERGSCALWLMDHMKDASWTSTSDSFISPYTQNENNEFNNTYGYWLLSSSPGDSTYARRVGCDGIVNNFFTAHGTYGARPVITVLKSDLSS